MNLTGAVLIATSDGNGVPQAVDESHPVSTNPGATTINNGQVALSTTAATLVAARTGRRRVTILNMDAAITIYIGKATVTSGNGFPLIAGASIRLETSALIQGIAASGTPTVAYVEEY